MSLSASRNVETSGDWFPLRMPGLNANVFYAGGFIQVDRSVGYVKEAADTANFIGFGVVSRQVTADQANGANEVEFMAPGSGAKLIKVSITGVDNQNDVGDPVYVTADDTLTMVATSNTKAIGTLTRYYGDGTKGDVSLYPFGTDVGMP
jgi:hypothetical protein